MGCGWSLALWMAQSYMSTAGGSGSVLPRVCTVLPRPDSQPPLRLPPPSHMLTTAWVTTFLSLASKVS